MIILLCLTAASSLLFVASAVLYYRMRTLATETTTYLHSLVDAQQETVQAVQNKQSFRFHATTQPNA